jgi:N-acyl-D-aspartate/D-glutamate deacylase
VVQEDAEMDNGFLIKGGVVIDGTGAPAFGADVRIRDGVIAEIGQSLSREGRERVIDASGCYVTPGFIEGHNHFDGPMWWTPSLEPMSGYGVTTSINGNCGFTAAPVHEEPALRDEMVRIFSFFEDIPEKPFLKLLPWDWKTWSEYRASLERNVKLPVNFASFAGHIAIRFAAMGGDAWERTATPAEIAKMCALLEDAIGAGALGMSSNLLDFDENGRPIPTRLADVAEWSALMDVIARHDGAVMQVIVDYLGRMDAPQTIELLATAARGKNIRIQVAGAVPTAQFQAPMIPGAIETFERLRAEGIDIWSGYTHSPITAVANFNSSLLFSQCNNYMWGEIIAAEGTAAKYALLNDPAWRERARKGWAETYDQAPIKHPDQIELFESESGAGPLGITLQDYMDRTGADHPSDALAEWVLENGPASILRLKPLPRHDETLARMFREPNAVGNLSDSGAHGQMFCGIGYNIQLLTEFARDRKLISVEEAVHIITGQPARHFNLRDRGVIEVGKAADVVVFNLAEIQMRPEKKRWDVPDGEGGLTYRWIRDPAPMRLTLVNGVPTFENGDFTGRFPGRYVAPIGEPQAAVVVPEPAYA